MPTIFTSPDVIFRNMLAVPLWLLYEAGICVARFVVVKPLPSQALAGR